MAVKSASKLPAFELDDQQQEAIEHFQGPLLVVAGAGTGKTTVLTRRIAHLVETGRARSDQILALTYTDNAAQEMRERVTSETGKSGVRISTFHAYCNDLLRSHGRQFDVLDDKDLWIYLRRNIRDLNLNYFIRAGNLSKFLEDLLIFMRRCQDELVGPQQYSEYVARITRGELGVPRVCKSKDAAELTSDEILGRCREIASVYEAVERMLENENLGTFGHMITRACGLLQDGAVLAAERERTRFILIDEFQDANFAQIKILQGLAGEAKNIFAVGDPDQAIYRFRGASSGAFGLFQRHFPGTKLIVLKKNRRSTTPILKCAFALISGNPAAKANFRVAENGKGPAHERSPLTSVRDENAVRAGEKLANRPVEVVVLSSRDTECSDAVNAIRKQQRQLHCQWKDIAVLYRLHNHRDDIARELAEQGIPFSIENMDVMDTAEVRDLLACLGAVVSEADSASLFRVAALPQFSIDPQKLRAGIRALPREAKSAGVAQVLRTIEGGSQILETLRLAREEILAGNAKAAPALAIMMRQFRLDGSNPALGAVMEFVKRWQKKPATISKNGEPRDLLEYLDYFREARGMICLPSNGHNAVHLLSAHSAKGLEFQHVHILRATSGSFPLSYKEPLVEFPRDLYDPDSAAEGDDKLLHEQEERRLFYVAMTRARDSLAIYAKQGTGKIDRTPPGFLRPLLKDSNLKPWLHQSSGRGFQTDLFAAAQAPAMTSRTSEWLALPAVSNLHEKLSATSIQTYETCPLQFKVEREWRIPGEVPAAMQYGAAIHRVLRTYFDAVRFQREMGEEELTNLLIADLAQAGMEDKYQHELYEHQGVEQLSGFLKLCREKPLPQVLHTEEPFEVRVGAGVIVGRIDRIDEAAGGGVIIVDYKTGKPRSQEYADKSIQLSIYALAAEEKWGYRAESLQFYNLEENSAVVTRRSPDQLEAARGKIEDIARNITAGNFEPKPGFYCQFCSYRNLCPATETRIHRTPA